MRAALLMALLLLPCATPTAIGASKEQSRVEVINQTSLRVEIVIEQEDENGNLQRLYTRTLEPGANPRFSLNRRRPFTVTANFVDVNDVRSREFEEGVTRVEITQDAQGKLQLSTPGDPPPAEPPPAESPPDASLPPQSLSRESLLAALSSSGLLGLALVGLLINRHK